MNKITDRVDFVNNHSHESLFIEAGAGAGKSTTMVDKIVHNILSGISPEKIVAITFTNKSAEDLLIRITKRIDKERKEATGKKKETLNNVFYSLYKMKISTIHSFCYKILSEYSFDAQIPYGVTLVKEEELNSSFEDGFNKWIRTLGSDDWRNFDNLAVALDKNPLRKIKDLYLYLCSRAMPDMEIMTADRFSLEPYYEEIQKIFLSISTNIDSGLSPSANLQKYYDKLYTFFMDLYPTCVGDDDPSIFEMYKDFIPLLKLPSATKCYKAQKGLELDAIEEYKNLYDAFEGKKEYIETYFNSDINDYALSAYLFYINNKKPDCITNNELIYKTYALMQNNKTALKKIADQYDVIYVDEFQDTDNYQIEIVRLLTQEIDKRKHKGDVGSLVVVGDPKQSIYRFRGADFQSYMGFKEVFPTLQKEDYNVVCLPDNFRSCSLILDWVNDTYSKMNFYDGYTYEPMLYPNNHKLIDYQNNPKALAGVYMRKLGDHDDYSSTAELVDYLVKNKYQIMVADPTDYKKPYIWKDIEYSDFMVIFASKTHLNSCAKAFAKRGIPYDITGRLEISGYEGIRELVRLINYLLIPEEDNKKTAIKVLAGHHSSIKESEAALETLANETKDMSSYGKIYHVFTNYDKYVNNINTIETKGLQAACYQILENIYRQPSMSAIDMMDAIFTLMLEFQDTALAIDRENNAVRIMNAHQTKGLEANIVIYISEAEASGVEENEILNGKLYLNCLNQQKTVKELCKRQILEEGLRKEYVVSTRARQVMIFDERLNGPVRGTRLYKIPDYQYDWDNLDQYHINEIPEDISTPLNDVTAPFKKNAIKKENKTNPPSYIELTPSQLEAREYDEEKEKAVNNVKRPKDNLFGTMLHRCNELYAKDPNRKIEDIVYTAMKENDCDSHYYGKYLFKCLYATKDLFEKEGFLKGKVEPEYKFYCYLEKDIPVLMNGSIDLLLVDKNRITIIDFKSDSADYQNKEQFEKVLKDNYFHQLDAYRTFISQVYPDYQIDLRIVWYEEIDDQVTARLLKL